MKKFLFLLSLFGAVQQIAAMMISLKVKKTDLDQQLLDKIQSVACVEDIRALIEKGADVNATNEDGETALMYAAVEGPTGTVLALIEKGADVNVQTEDGWTALRYAAVCGYTDTGTVLALIAKGADVNAQGNDGGTPLFWAARYGYIETVLVLIEKGADVNVADNSGRTALMRAAMNVADNSGRTAFMRAAMKGYIETVLVLIENGADVNARGENGNTALMWAAEKGNIKICRTMLSHLIILPKGSEQYFITVRCLFKRLNKKYKSKPFCNDVQYCILGMLPLENLVGLMYCNKYPLFLWPAFLSKVEDYTREQLIPMMVEASEKASTDELKMLLNPELFEGAFGEERSNNINNVLEQKKQYLRRVKSKVIVPKDKGEEFSEQNDQIEQQNLQESPIKHVMVEIKEEELGNSNGLGQKEFIEEELAAESLWSYYHTKAKENVALLTGVTGLSAYLLYQYLSGSGSTIKEGPKDTDYEGAVSSTLSLEDYKEKEQ